MITAIKSSALQYHSNNKLTRIIGRLQPLRLMISDMVRNYHELERRVGGNHPALSTNELRIIHVTIQKAAHK